jgi:hypothetical protein
MKNQIIIPMLAGALLVGGCTKTNVERASTEFNQLPAAVQKSVHSAVPEGEVANVDEDKRNGLTVYQIKFRDSDRHPDMWVSPDGTILRNEPSRAMGAPSDRANVNVGAAQSELSALPVAVQKSIQQNAPRAEVTSIRRNEQNGRVIYDIEYAGKKENPSIQVAEDGTLIKSLSTTEAPAPRY